MKNINRVHRPPQVVNKVRHCHECKEDAFGRCPDCHFSFCQEHFPKQQHSPCATRQMKMAQTQVCYVCGIQVYPDQWSHSTTSHFVDQFTCLGCGRYICEGLHTKRKTEDVVIIREGMRGHRYQYYHRYCDLCKPLYLVKGITGLAYVMVVAGTILATIFFSIHP